MKLRLEVLEDRFLLSAADVAAFQQQGPALHAEMVAIEPGLHAGLQQFVDSVKLQISAQQYQQAEAIISNLPALLDTWFYQQVANESAALLQIGHRAPAEQSQHAASITHSNTSLFFGFHGDYYGLGYGTTPANPMNNPYRPRTH